MNPTLNCLLLQASCLPMSIIIVGVGPAEFDGRSPRTCTFLGFNSELFLLFKELKIIFHKFAFMFAFCWNVLF